MKSSEPTMTDPTGQLSPLDRQNVMESASRASSDAGASSATAALKMRAPSTCIGRSFSFATAATAATSDWERTPPPHRFCVFSMQTSAVRGAWGSSGRTAFLTSLGSSIPRLSLGTVW